MKKMIALLTAILSVAGTAVSISSSATSVTHLSGDVNLDGVVDIEDGILLRNALWGQASLNDVQRTVADVNGDLHVNFVDLIYLNNIINGNASSTEITVDADENGNVNHFLNGNSALSIDANGWTANVDNSNGSSFQTSAYSMTAKSNGSNMFLNPFFASINNDNASLKYNPYIASSEVNYDDGKITANVLNNGYISINDTYFKNSKSVVQKAGETLNYISKTNTPKLTDKLVSEKTEYKTIEEYKKSIVDDLKKQKKDSAGSTAYGQVEDKAEVKKYPDSIVNTATSQLDAYYRYTAKQYGFDDFNTFLTQSGMTEDTYNVELKKAAQSVAKTQLLTEAIAEKEGITVTDDEITKEMQKVEEQGGTVDELKKNFKELYGDVISIEKYYKITLLTNKVIDMIGENAKIKE